MKKILLSLTILIMNLLTAIGANKIEANPINLAAILTEKNDSVSIASICEFYGYRNQPSQDGYTIFHHPNGSIIRYKFTIAEDNNKYSSIEVKSKVSHKEQEEILQNLKFQKTSNGYERRSFNLQTTCSSSQGYLRFVNRPKSKKK